MHADHRALLFEFEKYIPLGRIQVAEDLAGANHPCKWRSADGGLEEGRRKKEEGRSL
jgi:hypothetical protein